jgi:hypothetical protein
MMFVPLLGQPVGVYRGRRSGEWWVVRQHNRSWVMEEVTPDLKTRRVQNKRWPEHSLSTPSVFVHWDGAGEPRLVAPQARNQNAICLDPDGSARYLYLSHGRPLGMNATVRPDDRSRVLTTRRPEGASKDDPAWYMADVPCHRMAFPAVVNHPRCRAAAVVANYYGAAHGHSRLGTFFQNGPSDCYFYTDGSFYHLASRPVTTNGETVVLEDGHLLDLPPTAPWAGFVATPPAGDEGRQVELGHYTSAVFGDMVAGVTEEGGVWLARPGAAPTTYDFGKRVKTMQGAPEVAFSEDGLALAVSCVGGLLVIDLDC